MKIIIKLMNGDIGVFVIKINFGSRNFEELFKMEF